VTLNFAGIPGYQYDIERAEHSHGLGTGDHRCTGAGKPGCAGEWAAAISIAGVEYRFIKR
jgi:hypothetical protein